MKFQRETATDAADLPHRFEQAAERSDSCKVCAEKLQEPRHLAWERQQIAETAAASFQREVGS